MTDFNQVTLDEVTIGQHVTVWAIENGHRTWGQGGTITAMTPNLVLTVPGVDAHVFARPLFAQGKHTIEIEVPTDPSECVEYGDLGADCAGEVEWFDPSGRGRGVQRCERHRDQRADRYADSIERYADSAVAPDWFDPAYAGESWNPED